MAPTAPRKRPSIRAKSSSSNSGAGMIARPPPAHREGAILADSFVNTKKDKRLIKSSSFLNRIEKAHKKPLKRRRPNKKLVTTLENLADALPDVEDLVQDKERGEGKLKMLKALDLSNKMSSPKQSISRASLNSIPTSFASVSVGTPSDPLEKKLQAISSAKFQAIELGFPDLLSFASSYHGKEIQEKDYTCLCTAGAEIKKLCQTYNLRIMMLQPFANFEGWDKGSREREDAFIRANGWIKIMQAVGTDMLQVGSSDAPNMITDKKTIASDLAELADLLAPHGFRLAYENWCWATVAPTWQDVWSIVQLADRPNIGLCLDTFQTAGGEYGDPTTSTGLLSPFPSSAISLSDAYSSSLSLLATTVPPSKIYVLQLSDAYKPPSPFQNRTIDGLRPRSRWSHNFRPYLYNGGYLTEPCVAFAKAVLNTGARCWFSVEVFDGGNEGAEARVQEPGFGGFCQGAMGSVERLLAECVDTTD
ncbi:xylose isomerase-like protein [Diplocarpon rosae]|nr:xylose isomerase-like protein [Diplocarpon rosae]